jgi:nicotinamide-nucleotide amidase
MTSTLASFAKRVLDAARERNLSIVTAESCTAGKLSTLFSEVPGAGEQLHGGFVTYSKAAKTKLLGVSEVLLKQRGAVCVDVAIAMAQGALERSPGNVAVAITGVAGPERDEDENPVGFVCIAAVREGCAPVHAERHYGNIGRAKILQEAMADALHEVFRLIVDSEDTGTPDRSAAL